MARTREGALVNPVAGDRWESLGQVWTVTHNDAGSVTLDNNTYGPVVCKLEHLASFISHCRYAGGQESGGAEKRSKEK